MCLAPAAEMTVIEAACALVNMPSNGIQPDLYFDMARTGIRVFNVTSIELAIERMVRIMTPMMKNDAVAKAMEQLARFGQKAKLYLNHDQVKTFRQCKWRFGPEIDLESEIALQMGNECPHPGKYEHPPPKHEIVASSSSSHETGQRRNASRGKGRSKGQEARGQIAVPTPSVNRELLEELSRCKGASNTFWSSSARLLLADGFHAALMVSKQETCYYRESDLAIKLQRSLQLMGAPNDDVKETIHTVPFYNLTPTIRYAALCGQKDMREIQLTLAHPRAIFSYAHEHGLQHTMLEQAFGNRENIKAFCNSFKAIGISPQDVEEICTTICCGNSCKDWCDKHQLKHLPLHIEHLRAEVDLVKEHVWDGMSKGDKDVLSTHPRPQLTALLVMCQEHERKMLEACIKQLPVQAEVQGYLGDSFLVHDCWGVDIQSYLKDLEDQGIIASEKRFPASRQEYLDWFEAFNGKTLDLTPLTEFQLRILDAHRYASMWLWGKQRMQYRPDVSFAISIESLLPFYKDSITGKTQMWDEKQGRWLLEADSSLGGENLTIALRKVFQKTELKQKGNSKHLEPVTVEFDSSLFESGAFLGTLGTQVAKLRNDRDWPALDESTASRKIRNFKGGLCLDFNIVPEKTDDPRDYFYKILRASTKEDRISRSCPHEWKDYDNEHKWELFHLLDECEQWLDTHTLLSSDLEKKLNEQAKYHDALRTLFFEAHNDWNEALFSCKMFSNGVNGKRQGNSEHFTMHDDGIGSSAKGTLRAAYEDAMGNNNGGAQRGYCGIMDIACLAHENIQGGAPKPNEQLANCKGCALVFVDDFDATQVKLSAAKLRQLSGGNNLTVARKYKGEEIFTFDALLILMTNGLWKLDGQMMEADLRRIVRQLFPISFQNNPVGPNQRQKDAQIKRRVKDFASELFFLAICYHHIKQAHSKADRTLPLPPSAQSALEDLLQNNMGNETGDIVEDFIVNNISDWTPEAEQLPSSCNQIEDAFVTFAKSRNEFISIGEAKIEMKKHFKYKAGYAVPRAKGKRTSINAYIDEKTKVIKTLKSTKATSTTPASSSAASSSASR